MLEKVFDAHIHHTFDIPLEEAIAIFKAEFQETGTVAGVFLSCPHHSDGEKLYVDELQNVKTLCLKHAFSGSYAYAALVHSQGMTDTTEERLSREYLRQAQEYVAAGFDGIKMLEGYPSMRKAMGRSLCSPVYDRFYGYLEENGIPITLHLGNPKEYWDAENAPEEAFRQGRVCDGTYPTKEQLAEEAEGIMKKFPALRLTLAHFGFMSYDIGQADRWLNDYPNTRFDITPGGEQLLNMRKSWSEWERFFIDHQDKIVYGSDYYAFPHDEKWEENYSRRPRFLRQFFETDEEHVYLGETFRGVNLDPSILKKIYGENAKRELGTPKPIDLKYIKREAERLLAESDKRSLTDKLDLAYILQISSGS